MHPILDKLSERILHYAKGALTQANQHAVYFDPGNEHWDFISVTNAAHAGELFLKAIIAKEHPLLIFRDLFALDSGSDEMDLEELITRGKTHDFDKLPKVLWAVTGERIPNAKSYSQIRVLRNAIQHFCPAETEDFTGASLEFIYSNIDPLIFKHFGLFAINFHEDHTVGYDYVVSVLLSREIKFSIPEDFSITEIDIKEYIAGASPGYISWFTDELQRVGKANLLR
jgi:hypothetical protein